MRLGFRVVVVACLAAGIWPFSADSAVTDIVDAAKRGDGHAVHRLLQLDPSVVSATDASGYTALHWAAIRGHWRIVSELVAAGAPVNSVGADGGTPLHWACHHDRPDMVALLLDAGADVSVANRWGRTALHVAARRDCRGVAALLLDRGADAGAVTLEGWTPLHVASISGNDEMAALLLARGADPGVRDGSGNRPADLYHPRPEPVEPDASGWDELVGLYDLGHGSTVKIWQEEGALRIREYAPDELYAVGRDEFACRQEPWRVRFRRGEDGAVEGVEVEFLRRTVDGTRMHTPRYVGSRACQSCHLSRESGSQSVQWLQSRHAHAYWRLGADWALFLGRLRPQYADLESPISDERCLLCHTTGAQDPDALFEPGFRVEEGVGCEACHGPGSEYMDPEVMADREAFVEHGGRVPDAATCRSCHRASERFDFDEWWPKIAHPRPAPAPDATTAG